MVDVHRWAHRANARLLALAERPLLHKVDSGWRRCDRDIGRKLWEPAERSVRQRPHEDEAHAAIRGSERAACRARVPGRRAPVETASAKRGSARRRHLLPTKTWRRNLQRGNCCIHHTKVTPCTETRLAPRQHCFAVRVSQNVGCNTLITIPQEIQISRFAGSREGRR